MRAILALVVVAAALALVGTASAAAPLTIAFKPATPAPKVTVKWPYKIVVTAAGKPVKGSLTIMLLDPIGQVHQVMDDALKPIKARAFTGTFSDKILFPAEAKGFTLTLRFTVTSAAGKGTSEVKVTPK